MKAIIANLGFVLQTSGILIVIAVPAGFVYKEQSSIIALFITIAAFLGAGFVMNALSERKELDFKSSCTLILLVFVILGVLGAIPYLYTDTFAGSSIVSKIVNSIFESISGYTTTGLSMINNPDALPRSIVLYRALTQWIGGIGIVFMAVIFFSSVKSLEGLSRAIGVGRLTSSLRASYLSVLVIYTAYSAVFIGLLYFAGIRSWVTNISLVFTTISTGGFSPVTNYSSLISFPIGIIIGVLMVFGATSFLVHYRLFTGKFAKLLDVEFAGLVLIIAAFSLILWALNKGDFSHSVFLVTSASSTTGSSLVNTGNLDIDVKTALFMLMFIGGSTYSTAGGVKISSVLMFFKSIPWMIKGLLTGKLEKFTLRSEEYALPDLFANAMVFLMAIGLIIIFAFIFTLYGYPLIDSIFELTSAFSTTGLSAGLTGIALPELLKVLLMIAMIAGRIGLIVLIIAFVPKLKAPTKLKDEETPTPVSLP